MSNISGEQKIHTLTDAVELLAFPGPAKSVAAVLSDLAAAGKRSISWESPTGHIFGTSAALRLRFRGKWRGIPSLFAVTHWGTYTSMNTSHSTQGTLASKAHHQSNCGGQARNQCGYNPTSEHVRAESIVHEEDKSGRGWPNRCCYPPPESAGATQGGCNRRKTRSKRNGSEDFYPHTISILVQKRTQVDSLFQSTMPSKVEHRRRLRTVERRRARKACCRQ